MRIMTSLPMTEMVIVSLLLSAQTMTKTYKLFEIKFSVINYKTYLIFLFGSLAISIGLQMLLPWPFGLITALAIFIVFPLFLRKRALRRMGGFGDGGGFFGQSQGIKYICLTCSNKFKGGACPRCGSKMKRADF